MRERSLRVWLGPDRPAEVEAAVRRAGGRLVSEPDANVVVWSASDAEPTAIRAIIRPGIELVQLDSAGVDHLLSEGVVDRERTWAAAQGVYAEALAEHALALLFAGAKRLPVAAHARTWGAVAGRGLRGSTVGVVGAGGIGGRLLELLEPLGVSTLALTRSGRRVPAADRSLDPSGLGELFAESDYAVLCAPLTKATHGLVGRAELELLGSNGWLVNVGRGQLVDTDALVEALRAGRLGGACLDVTDPEPLPDGHPLWQFENVLVTPHASRPPDAHFHDLAIRVEENLRRFATGRQLLGVVDLDRGY